jgi:hypothetical protein
VSEQKDREQYMKDWLRVGCRGHITLAYLTEIAERTKRYGWTDADHMGAADAVEKIRRWKEAEWQQ